MKCPSLNDLPPPPPGKTGWPWTEESPALPAKMDDGSPWPKISIITPSLNQGQFIEETIRSILLQGYPNIEYIIIDGGSKDDTVHIIKKYERWLSYWVSEADKGQAQAINKGFRKATGEILAWLNSDDYYEKAILNHVATHFLNDFNSDFIYGDINVIDKDGRVIQTRVSEKFNIINKLYYAIVPQQSCFWRSSVFNDMELLKENYHFAFDNEFFLRCGIKKHFTYLPILLANYRHHPDSKTITQQLCFLVERFNFINDLFLKTPLPPDFILVHKIEVLRHWNERIAIAYFHNDMMKEARKHFIKAIFYKPLRIQNIKILFYILLTYFGQNNKWKCLSIYK